MSRQWTPEQKQAIEDRGGALLLAAAAGSGKTAVLTQRAVELIADEAAGITADRLLIVTFTNAAAAELRQRMAAALDEKLANAPGSVWLKQQKLLLGRAAICTVDSFCIDLLTQHFTETDLPGDFTVIKAAEEETLRQEALAEALEEAYENAAFRQFASLYGKARSDAAAADAVLRLYDIARSMAEPERWWRSLADDYRVMSSPADTHWGKELLTDAALRLEAVHTRLTHALALSQEDADLAKITEALQTELAQADRIHEAVTACDWQLACRYSQSAVFARFPSVRKGDAQLKGRIKELRGECKDIVTGLAKKIFITNVEEFRAEQAICLPMVEALSAAVQRFSSLLFEKKRELKAFSFDDFEHAALRLLQNEDGSRTLLAQELGGYWATVMVDEYQDTNDLQDRLYRLLARPDGSNLFFVGDVKQSIYGFREAKPECFIEKMDTFAPYDGQHYPASILLNRNFRSSASVLYAINDLFEPVFRRGAGGVDYTCGEQLIPGLGETALEEPVRIVITENAAAGADDSETVAQLIAGMLAGGTPVRDGAGTRPCRPGDFCILMRAPGAKGRLYTEKLERRGIGALCRAEDALLGDAQVQLLLCFLRVLDNPGQDIPLTALLLCPVYGFSPDDLTAVRLACRKGTLYAALLRCCGEDGESTAPDGLAARVRAFLASLRTLRRRALGMPVQEICAMLLDETGLFHLAGALPGGESSQQNLRAFQNVCGEYAGSGGLSGFLRLVDACIKNGRPLTGSRGMGGTADRVQLMSIHSSKGLEFPIVILADAAHSFNTRDAYGNLLRHSELGVGLKLQTAGTRTLVPTLALRAIASRMQRDTADEEMRLLYVALTRARDRLILSWCEKKPLSSFNESALTLDACEKPDLYALRTASSMSRWLLLALLRHPDAALMRQLSGWKDLNPRLDTAGHFAVELCAAAEEPAKVCSAVLRTAQPDAELIAALQRNFAQQPAAAAPLPVKVSVSALSRKDAAPVLEKPSFLLKEGMTAAQRGTALHRFLQLADLAAARRDSKSELARLVDGGYIAPDAARAIDRQVLQRFLQSDLLARMLAAPALLREYEFISRIPAALTAQQPEAGAQDTVFLLGIADCVLLYGDTAELVDYKTDRGKTPQQFLDAYAAQLALYRDAIEKRLKVTVTRSVIYSFELGQEIEVP